MEELYDVVHKVAELSIASDSESVRIQSRQVGQLGSTVRIHRGRV